MWQICFYNLRHTSHFLRVSVSIHRAVGRFSSVSGWLEIWRSECTDTLSGGQPCLKSLGVDRCKDRSSSCLTLSLCLRSFVWAFRLHASAFAPVCEQVFLVSVRWVCPLPFLSGAAEEWTCVFRHSASHTGLWEVLFNAFPVPFLKFQPSQRKRRIAYYVWRKLQAPKYRTNAFTPCSLSLTPADSWSCYIPPPSFLLLSLILSLFFPHTHLHVPSTIHVYCRPASKAVFNFYRVV